MDVKLHMFSGSNAVLTAQLMLAHKGIAYQRVNLFPAAHTVILLGLGFETMTVPALKADGRRVHRTRAISRFLDEVIRRSTSTSTPSEIRRPMSRPCAGSSTTQTSAPSITG